MVPRSQKQVADQLMAHDAIGAHARDELGFAPNQNPVFVEVTSDADWATGISFSRWTPRQYKLRELHQR